MKEDVAEQIPLGVHGTEESGVNKIGKVSDEERLFARKVIQDDFFDVADGHPIIIGVNVREDNSGIVKVDKLVVSEVQIGES